MIRLIINADDFGYSKIFNEKILDLLEKDFLKSTTVLVNWITKEQKKQIERLNKLREEKDISVGLHIESVSLERSELNKEIIQKQFDKFKNVFGFNPSHVDVHKFIKSTKEATNFANEKDLPIRNHGQKNIKTKTTSTEAFGFESTWTFNWPEMNEFLNKIEDGNTYELIVHPGEYDPDCESRVNESRKEDYKGVIDLQPILKEKEIQIISYNDL